MQPEHKSIVIKSTSHWIIKTYFVPYASHVGLVIGMIIVQAYFQQLCLTDIDIDSTNKGFFHKYRIAKTELRLWHG